MQGRERSKSGQTGLLAEGWELLSVIKEVPVEEQGTAEQATDEASVDGPREKHSQQAAG